MGELIGTLNRGALRIIVPEVERDNQTRVNTIPKQTAQKKKELVKKLQ